MNKEQLLAQGFSDAQVTTILDLFKKSLDGNYVPKHRFDEVNQELKDAKQQITDRDGQIKSLKKFEGDSQALQDKIKELEDQNKQKDDEYKANLTLEKKKNALRMSLLEDVNGKPHDADMVMGLFDLNKIVFDESTGKITDGYKTQNDTIRKEKAFLFEVKQEPGKPNGWKPKGAEPKDGDNNSPTGTYEAYGKSLAAIKLGMMGITPEDK